MGMTKAQLKLAKLAYKVVDGKATMAQYREAEKRHNQKLHNEVKK